MKRTTTKKSAPLSFAKKRAAGHPTRKTDKARAKQQCAQMPEYLLEEHPELMFAEALPGLLKARRKP
jgi:hypothetical protein